MPLLTLSDLVSGGLCVAYDNLMLRKPISAERFTEQVVYRVAGRAINEKTNLPTMALPVVSENDLYAGGLAVVDSMVRSKQSTNASLYDGARALVSSALADHTLKAVGFTDRVLL